MSDSLFPRNFSNQPLIPHFDPAMPPHKENTEHSPAKEKKEKKEKKGKKEKQDIPLHIQAACVRIKYEDGIEGIRELFGCNSPAVIQAIENSSPEMKLTLALALGLSVDLSNYEIRGNSEYKPWMSNPFLDPYTASELSKRLQAPADDRLVHIYGSGSQGVLILAAVINGMRESLRALSRMPVKLDAIDGLKKF
ncbi:MAG: hypothetical protein FWH04_00865 [Oscillospiraceae bacterium]|nr:hypothetical protein [Oscillospiraceae bacterium]